MSTTTSFLRPLVLVVWAALGASVMAVMLANPAWAATLTVSTAADEQTTNNVCSLREAIINANANNQSGSTDCSAGTGEDTIVFDQSLRGQQTITLASKLPDLTDTAGLTIDGTNADITISGNDLVRVFQEKSDAKLILDKLTVAHGRVRRDSGGGIANWGTLEVINSTLSGNKAGYGGGIENYSVGTVTLKNTIVANSFVSNSTSGGIVARPVAAGPLPTAATTSPRTLPAASPQLTTPSPALTLCSSPSLTTAVPRLPMSYNQQAPP